MSYIFEALQRAEAERSGGSEPKNVDSVAELLQGVEQEIARKLAAERAGAALPKNAVPAERLVEEIKAQAAVTPVADVETSGRRVKSADPATALPPVVVQPVMVQPVSAQPVVELQAAQRRETREPSREDSPKTAISDLAPVAKAESPVTDSFADAKVLSPAIATDSRLVCLTDQGSLAAEKFRVLGLKLRHLRERRKLKRIVVTGTAPEEGKSLVAANLALNQSRSKVLKTLLIDGDLRRPTVASRFGFARSLPGLSECLRGEQELSEVVYKLNGSGLWFLPAGHTPENPLELMQGGRLPELLERLGKFFEWIIIDTPPVVPVADTTFWMKQADGVLMVIREGVSEKKVVERALESFDRSVLLGVVVNSCGRCEHENYYSRYGQPVVPGGGIPLLTESD
jgi:capsular exopolysaccharide synthesis family protein